MQGRPLSLTLNSLLALLNSLAHKGWDALGAHTSPFIVQTLPNLQGPVQLPLPAGSLLSLLPHHRTYCSLPEAPRASKIRLWVSPGVGSWINSLPVPHSYSEPSSGMPNHSMANKCLLHGGRWVVMELFDSALPPLTTCFSSAQSMHV